MSENTLPTWELLKKFTILMCNDDLYFLSNIIFLVWEHNNYLPNISKEKLQEDTLNLIKELHRERLIKVFSLTTDEVVELKNLDTEEIIKFIKVEWDKTNEKIPDENKIAWFETSLKGEKEANMITEFNPD